MRQDQKRQSSLKSVAVAGHIVEVKPDKLLVHCDPDGQERWVKKTDCKCFGPWQKGTECRATLSVNEIRLTDGCLPGWVGKKPARYSQMKISAA